MRDLSNEKIQRSALRLGHRFPEMTDKEIFNYFKRGAYISALAEKILETEVCDLEFAKTEAAIIYDSLPAEFRVNIEEYVNDKPLTPIMYRNKSLNYIMHMHQADEGKIYSFLQAATIMRKFIKEGDNANDKFCEYYFYGRYDTYK